MGPTSCDGGFFGALAREQALAPAAAAASVTTSRSCSCRHVALRRRVRQRRTCCREPLRPARAARYNHSSLATDALELSAPLQALRAFFVL